MRVLNCLALVLWLVQVAAEVRGEDYSGIGIVLRVEGTNIVVEGIMPDSPAAAQKTIRVGDRIIAIAQDKEPAVQIQSVKLAQIVPMFRGPKGTTVHVTIVPAGEDDSRARVVSFVRGEVKGLWGDGVLLGKGVKAPDIEMLGLAKNTSERLSDYADKIVVLEFWATWCGPCQKKMADLQSYPAKYPDWKDKVVLIAASIDDNKDAAVRHLKAKEWNETHNVWIQSEAMRAFHADGIPTVYVLNRRGEILAAGVGGLVDIPGTVNHELEVR